MAGRAGHHGVHRRPPGGGRHQAWVGSTARAARIAAGDFSAHLDTPVVDDELGRMTRSLNGVLERLHAALEANRRFASDASHELRGPLTAMTGEIDVTLRQPRTAAEYRDALRVVRERLSSQTALAEDLILLVRAQEGGGQIVLREVPLAPLVRASIARLDATARAHGVSIDVRPQPRGAAEPPLARARPKPQSGPSRDPW